MIKKNKHLLKLLSLSLLPIAAISVPAVLLTSCGSKKSDNNSGNNSGDDSGNNNNGDNNNNTTVTNSTYPTFASADEVRKACDEAKIDSKYESEPTFKTTHPNKIAINNNMSNIHIYYPENEYVDNMNYIYVNVISYYDHSISTNFADYPIYAWKDGQKYYINPNKAILLDKIPELYMLSDEQLQYDSEEVHQTYQTYRNRELWFKVDVSDVKEELNNLSNSDFDSDTYYFYYDIIDSDNQQTSARVSSLRYNSIENVFSSRKIWTYRLSNDMRFGLKGDIINEYLYDFINMHDSHPSSYSYDTETIDPNKFGGVVAMKYLKQHPKAVRFIDSIAFNAGVNKGGVITSDYIWNNNGSWNYFYIKKSNDLETISSSLNNIKDTYDQYSRGDTFPEIRIDAKKMYDNVDLSTLQLKKLENGMNWYVPDSSTNLIDLLLTVNNNKILGDIAFNVDFNNSPSSTIWNNYGVQSDLSIFLSTLAPTYYYPNFAVQSPPGSTGYTRLKEYIDQFCYSTFTINFNQPNIK